MKHLLKLLDLSKEEIIDILNLPTSSSRDKARHRAPSTSKGKCLA